RPRKRRANHEPDDIADEEEERWTDESYQVPVGAYSPADHRAQEPPDTATGRYQPGHYQSGQGWSVGSPLDANAHDDRDSCRDRELAQVESIDEERQHADACDGRKSDHPGDDCSVHGQIGRA